MREEKIMPMKKTTTLIIHAPHAKVKEKGSKSFEDIFASGVGKGYAIYDKDEKELIKGSTVVLLRKDKNKRRAEGLLDKWVPTERTNNGIQRYDIHVEKWTEDPYKPEELNRCGVAVIDC